MSDQLIIFDTTLRDGEQSPGASMTRDEKLRIARQLERLKVDVIEAGFAAASNGDFESIQTIARAIKDSTVCSLSRANDRDIARAAESLKDANRARIHTFIATSALHMEKKLRMTPEQVLEQAKQAVRFGRNLIEDIEFSAEDGYRSEPDFLARVIEASSRKVQPPSTCPTPWVTRFPSSMANSFATARARAQQRQGRLVRALPQRPGHGGGQFAGGREDRRRAPDRVHHQRSGRARGQLLTEEVVMAIKTRKDYFGLDVNIDTQQIVAASRWSARPRALWCSPTRLVGANAFAHASGIHQDGVLKARDTYEIMRAEDVGWAANKIVLGKLSGRNAFKQRLQELGVELDSEAAINQAFTRFKELADRKSEILTRTFWRW
jgi:2-isopropylmalate synthase